MANETVLFKRGDSATITSTPVTDGQILFDTSGNGKMYLDNGTDRLEMGGAITVDASLSKTSTNAIQNKAVTGNILNSLAEVSAATQQNTIAGALALKEVNSSLIGLAMLPDYSQKENLNLSIGDSYTASKNGYLFITAKGTSGQAISLLHGSDYIIGNSISETNYVASVQAPMAKGDTLKIGGNATSIYSSLFVPAKN